jgi:hypothetical protein
MIAGEPRHPESAMGPREALEHIRALIREALATNDIDTAHRLLRDMLALTGKVVRPSTLRRGRLIRRISA